MIHFIIQQIVIEHVIRHLNEKKTEVASMIEETSEVNRRKEELKQRLSLVSWLHLFASQLEQANFFSV